MGLLDRPNRDYVDRQRAALRLYRLEKHSLRKMSVDEAVEEYLGDGFTRAEIEAAHARVWKDPDWRKHVRGNDPRAGDEPAACPPVPVPVPVPARKPVFQPAGSNLCGQACVAMVVGLTLEESIEAFRRSKAPVGLTGARHLRKVLRWFGFEMGDRPVRLKKPISSFEPRASSFELRAHRSQLTAHSSSLWICRMRWKGVKKTHWVLVDDGHVLDPGLSHLVAEGMSMDEAVAVYVKDTGAYLSSAYSVVELEKGQDDSKG